MSDESTATSTPTTNEMTTKPTCGVIGNSDVGVAAEEREQGDEAEAGGDADGGAADAEDERLPEEDAARTGGPSCPSP